MKLNEVDEEIFIDYYLEYVDKFGKESVKGWYELHRKYSRELFIKNMPTTELFRLAFFEEFDEELKKQNNLHKVAEKLSAKNAISKRVIYDFYHNHYNRIKKIFANHVCKSNT